MGRVSGALEMLSELMKHDICRIDELSKKLNVSDRQIRTYYNDLKVAGINVKSKTGINGGYYLVKDSCPLCKQKIR